MVCAVWTFSCSSFTFYRSILINFSTYHLQFVVCCSSFISFSFSEECLQFTVSRYCFLIVVLYLKFSLTMDHDHCITTLYSGSTNIHSLLCNQFLWMSKFNIQVTGSWSSTNCLYFNVLWWCLQSFSMFIAYCEWDTWSSWLITVYIEICFCDCTVGQLPFTFYSSLWKDHDVCLLNISKTNYSLFILYTVLFT